ncbi:MAG: hypothetical protein JNM56_32090 [Planctomycetia bacterium]|nr:hypothetical protein [Planctomycetia bacterium]
MHALARQVGRIDAVDQGLHLLKFHFPDHVLTFAYNALCDGTCLQDLELRRQDEVFLDALGARRIPDPTTAGDFCRRFTEPSIRQLQDLVHDVRVGVWARQPAEFFRQARIDMDGCLIETTGQVKEAVVVRREHENIKLVSEQVAEFNYRPTACRHTHRMVVVCKNLSVAKGERLLFDDVRYCFYLTNDWVSEAAELVFSANDRCHQENLLAQLQSGVRALRAPLDNLVSNWAYLVMTALAWDLKTWWALRLPEEPGRWQEQHRAQKRWLLGLEFKTFVNAFMRIPCQLVRIGRRLVYRLLAWNPHLPVLFRVVEQLRC